MKAVVAAFNQEKALVGAFSVITNLRMELSEALIFTSEFYPNCFIHCISGAAAAVWQNIYSSHFEVKFTSPKIHSYKQGESLVATMEYTDKRGRAVSRICGLMIIL